MGDRAAAYMRYWSFFIPNPQPKPILNFLKDGKWVDRENAISYLYSFYRLSLKVISYLRHIFATQMTCMYLLFAWRGRNWWRRNAIDGANPIFF